ncbi:MAG: ABC transporter ATP-binding protein [Verrucomicrobia bacterium]|nr:ABC transporter ATP-binding protein [Verrucomicrobiota bacterium]
MSDTIISVEGLGKRYALNHKNGDGERYTTLRDVIARRVSAPVRWLHARRGAPNATLVNGSSIPALHSITRNSRSQEDFWALRDVSFEIKQGDAVGIIGRNGAGKSTLLKILSRITEPTKGRIRIRGRVASLLEVGTGFHPELTGRENIFLNGSILGMSRTEIKKKFDEIVAFAETEKFLDTPVKRYSSGMYVRLAFAVAAHLEPEILIVDEVLAVGDAAFQKKCLGKLQDVAAKEARTVLFVSHNLDSILRLCDRVLWLDAGSLRAIGRPAGIVQAYNQQWSNDSRVILLSERQRPNWVRQKAIVEEVSCLAEEGTGWSYPFGSPLEFACTLLVRSRISTLLMAYAVFTPSGFEIASTRAPCEFPAPYFEPGRYKVRVSIPYLRLAPGNYSLNLGVVSELGHEDFVTEVAVFEVPPNERSADHFADTIRAACIPEVRFTVEQLEETISVLPEGVK